MYFLLLILFSITSSLALDCKITSVDQIAPALVQCQRITVGNLQVPQGQFLDFKLKEDSSLSFVGNITFGVAYQDRFPLVRITGTDITIDASPDSLLDGQGKQYWDGRGTNSDRRKPVLLEIQGQNVNVEGLNIRNCPETCVRIHKSENVIIRNTNIDVSGGIKNGIAVDTHGITVSNSSDVIVKYANVSNFGDCVAVLQGTDIIFDKITCTGSQGLTVRPVWELANRIEGVTFNNCTVIEGQTGIRVVTSPHQANGSISTVVYKNIQVVGILFRGIDVRQNLDDEEHPADNISISDLSIYKVSGTMTNKYVRAVYILCGSTTTCADWLWSKINIEKAEVENSCNCVPTGWSCW